MQVSLSDTGGLSRRLEVAVPATEVAREVQQRLKRLSRTARLKGFRPGKAPLTVIAKQFGEQVRAEVLSDLVRSSFAQAVSEQKLRPAGGPRIVHAVFAATHPNKKLAGQSAELHLSIKAVEEHSLPAVDDEFFRTYGVEQGGLAEMRAEVRKSMERELAEVVRGRVRTQLLDALYRDNPIELPRALIEEQVQELQLDTARRLGIRDASRLPRHESFEEPARRRVALGLLMSQIAQSQGLKADRERVAARLTDLAEGYPDPEEARRAYLRNPQAMRSIEAAVLEERVVDFLLERARGPERRTSFSELTGFGRSPAGEDAPHQHEPRHDPQ